MPSMLPHSKKGRWFKGRSIHVITTYKSLTSPPSCVSNWSEIPVLTYEWFLKLRNLPIHSTFQIKLRLEAVDYFRQRFHFRCLTGSWAPMLNVEQWIKTPNSYPFVNRLPENIANKRRCIVSVCGMYLIKCYKSFR